MSFEARRAYDSERKLPLATTEKLLSYKNASEEMLLDVFITLRDINKDKKVSDWSEQDKLVFEVIKNHPKGGERRDSFAIQLEGKNIWNETTLKDF